MTEPNIDVPHESPPSELALERDCIIFIPGMGSGSVDQSIAGVADRFARVLELNAKDRTADFYTKIEPATGLNDCSGEVGTVFRKDASGTRAILDIYKFDYRSSLVDRYEKRNLLVKALLLLAMLPGTTLRVVGAMFSRRSAKTRVEIFQLLYALGILSLLVIYIGILFLAIWKTAVELGLGVPNPGAVPALLGSYRPEWLSGYVPGWVKNWNLAKVSQAVVVISAAGAVLLPSRLTVKTLIGQAAVISLSMIYYLNLGEGRSAIFGKLESLIDSLLKKSAIAKREKINGGYRHVSVLAYSFGSIVALDSFFPTDRDPATVFKEVYALVTIGCPFDFVRSLWRGYFDSRRKFAPNCPERWLNVYSPEDILGSNFRNGSERGDADVTVQGAARTKDPDVPLPQKNIIFTQGVEYSRLSWLDSFTLLGLRSHGMYWGANATETNCFDDLVPEMFEGDPALG
jgi:hypothetical protein